MSEEMIEKKYCGDCLLHRLKRRNDIVTGEKICVAEAWKGQLMTDWWPACSSFKDKDNNWVQIQDAELPNGISRYFPKMGKHIQQEMLNAGYRYVPSLDKRKKEQDD